MSRFWYFMLGFGAIAILRVSPAQAQISDPANDFLSSYAGPKGGDLDVVSASGALQGDHFTFAATMNAPLFTTSNSLYVWGIDRGQGVARFPTIAPGVLFDSVIVVTLLSGGNVTAVANGHNLSASDVTISGDDISVTVPTADLPNNGFTFSQYTWNLWPRNSTGGLTGINQITDFAPDNSNAAVTPEPSFLALFLGLSCSGAGFLLRRRR